LAIVTFHVTQGIRLNQLSLDLFSSGMQVANLMKQSYRSLLSGSSNHYAAFRALFSSGCFDVVDTLSYSWKLERAEKQKNCATYMLASAASRLHNPFGAEGRIFKSSSFDFRFFPLFDWLVGKALWVF